MRYLRRRRGRWLVQVAVPEELRSHFGKTNVERYLGTSSETDAKRLRHAVVGEILAAFDRAREGGPSRPEELKAQGEAELRRAYDALAANFLDSYGRLPRLAKENATPGGPDRKRGHTRAKRFPSFRRDQGVDRERVAFHSFRKSFVRALELAKVDRDRAALVVGHERGFTFRVDNPEGIDVARLRHVVEAVR